MIAGTFVFEDQSIQFCTLKDGRIEYTVQDALSGVTATRNVNTSEFGAAMHLALSGNAALIGDDNADGRMYALAEDAMPTAYNVNIPDDEVLEDSVLQALRWIP